MVSHPLEKYIMLEECIIQLAKYGRIILDLDNVMKANHVCNQTKELVTSQFESLEPIVLHEHGLLNPITPKGSLSIRFVNKIIANMTLCFEVEEETDEEEDKEANSTGEMNKTLATLEDMPMHLN